jgi:hypothetical protein
MAASILTPNASISALSISPTGSLVAVADADGTVVKVFRVRSRGKNVWRSQQIARQGSTLPPSSPRPPRPPSLSPPPTPSFDVYVSPRGRRRSSTSSSGGGNTKPVVGSFGSTPRGASGPDNATLGSASAAGEPPSNIWHVYDLVRGVTRAKVESIVWSHDERWVGIGTAAGTLRMSGRLLLEIYSWLTELYRRLPNESIRRVSRRGFPP